MPRNEITRRYYRREGLRYASDLTGAECSLMEPFYAGVEFDRTPVVSSAAPARPSSVRLLRRALRITSRTSSGALTRAVWSTIWPKY